MPGDESYDEHEELRARLAAEPAPRMPEDVATRLHEALAEESRRRTAATGTAAEPEEPTAPATVTPLRRPGRWKAPLLAAAAVIAVIAVAVPVVNQVSGDTEGDASSSDAGSSTLADGATEGRQRQAPDADAAPQATLDRPELTRSDFDADVREQLSGADLAREPATSLRTAVRCRDGVPSSAIGRPVTLDGEPAVVLSSRSRGVVPGTEVRAVVCGPDGPEVAARTMLPDQR